MKKAFSLIIALIMVFVFATEAYSDSVPLFSEIYTMENNHFMFTDAYFTENTLITLHVRIDAEKNHRIKGLYIKKSDGTIVASKTDFTEDDIYTDTSISFDLDIMYLVYEDGYYAYVEFADILYNISYTEVEGGNLSGKNQNKCNDTVSVTATPQKGYWFDPETVCFYDSGDNILDLEYTPTDTGFDFKMTDTDIRIYADFWPKYELENFVSGENTKYDTLQEAIDNASSEDDHIRAYFSGSATVNEEKEFWLHPITENTILNVYAGKGYDIEILEDYGSDGILYKVVKKPAKTKVEIYGIGEEQEENPETGAPLMNVTATTMLLASLAYVLKKKK